MVNQQGTARPDNPGTSQDRNPRVIDDFLRKAVNRNHWFYIPFWIIGGGIPQLLKHYPEDWNKYFGTGAAILMTAVFAAISGGYAISTVFNDFPDAPYIFGTIWGLFILLLDRYFVTSMMKTPDNSFWVGFRVAWLRILLAIFIGFIISRPLELRIAQPEINMALDTTYTGQRERIMADFDQRIFAVEGQTFNQSRLTPYETKINNLQEQKEALELEISQQFNYARALADSVQCECQGACGTKLRGRGPACRFWEREHAAAKIDLTKIKQRNEPKIIRIETQIVQQQNSIQGEQTRDGENKKSRKDRLGIERDSVLAQLDRSNRESLINRNKVLHNLAKQDDSIWWMITFLTALFVFIETAPILIKLISRYGAYDAALDALRERGQQQAKLDRNISKEEIKLNRILLGQISRAQQEILIEKVANWEQKNRLNNGRQAEAAPVGQFRSPEGYSSLGEEDGYDNVNDPYEDLGGNNDDWKNPELDGPEED